MEMVLEREWFSVHPCMLTFTFPWFSFSSVKQLFSQLFVEYIFGSNEVENYFSTVPRMGWTWLFKEKKINLFLFLQMNK